MKSVFLKFLSQKNKERFMSSFFSNNLSYKQKINSIDKSFPSACSEWENYIDHKTIFFNFLNMQQEWLLENANITYKETSNKSYADLLKIQLKIINPYFIVVSHVETLKTKYPEIIILIKELNIKLIAWYGAPIDYKYFIDYDAVLSINQVLYNKLKKSGYKKTFILKHAFPTSALTKTDNETKDIKLSFIGSLLDYDKFHSERIKLVRFLFNNIDISIFSEKIIDSNLLFEIKINLLSYKQKLLHRLRLNREVHPNENFYKKTLESIRFQKSFLPPVFGLEYFQILSNSLISLNKHISYTSNLCANMRLYEATGVGSCLLTEHLTDIEEYFKPDSEIVTYKSREEALEKANYLLSNEKVALEIGKAGQKRTLSCYTSKQQAKSFTEILKKI